MFGYCATGMTHSANAPARVMTMAMTMANFGRSMKNPESIGYCPPPLPLLAEACWPGGGVRCALTTCPGLHLLQAVDDHVLAALQPVGDDPFLVELMPDLDVLLADLVVRTDKQ